MGEKQTKPFQLSFNGSLKVDFQGSHVTSDGGLILVRELDERLGLGELIDEHRSDSRQGTNKQFTLADLLRQSIYSRLAGYEDVNDAVRVSADPTFRLIGSQKIWDRGAALTSTLHGFETEMLASEENLLGLLALNRELVGQAEAFDDSERVVLDMDFQNLRRKEIWVRRAAEADTASPKNGKLKFPTNLLRLTRLSTLKASTLVVTRAPLLFFPRCNEKVFDQRRFRPTYPGPWRLFLLTPGGRSRARVSPLSSRPVVTVYGLPERAVNTTPRLKSFAASKVP